MASFFKTHFLIILIICLAAFFRLYLLDVVPPSPSLDEVSIGYNAYSILKTGKDEYGTAFPLLLRAYDDWRPAIYVYVVIPFVWVLGLTTVAVRIPSVLMSIGTVYLVYGLCRDLFKSNKYQKHMALIASLLLAISPWHIYISRLGHEANLGLSALIGGAYLFVHAIMANRPKILITSAALFAVSFSAYQSEKIVVPLIVLVLVLVYRGSLLRQRKISIAAAVVGLLISLPLLVATFSTPGALIRFQATSAFDPSQKKITNAKLFAANYISHFKPSWLFWGDRRESHKVPYLGLMYIWEAPFFFLGLLLLLGKWKEGPSKLFLSWMLIAPIPAAIATQTPHAMRAFTMVPAPQIIESIALVWILNALPKAGKQLFIVVATISAVVGLVALLNNYFSVFPTEQSDSFQYSLAQAIRYILKNKVRVKRTIVTNEQAGYQSYMFYLFFSGYEPAKYLREGGTTSGGFAETHTIGTVTFAPIRWDTKEQSQLLFDNVNHIPSSFNPQQIFFEKNGTPTLGAVYR